MRWDCVWWPGLILRRSAGWCMWEESAEACHLLTSKIDSRCSGRLRIVQSISGVTGEIYKLVSWEVFELQYRFGFCSVSWYIFSAFLFSPSRDNYGFVTYYNRDDAYAAIENGSKLRRPDELPFDICFGGRRQFCKSNYADLGWSDEWFLTYSVQLIWAEIHFYIVFQVEPRIRAVRLTEIKTIAIAHFCGVKIKKLRAINISVQLY